MKSYHIESFKNISGIVLREQEIPQPKRNEVLIKVRAVSLNRRDLYILNQTYPLSAKLDIVPASDGAGEVIAIGDDVNRLKIGDRVIGSYFAKWRDGNVGIDVMDQLGCTLDGMLSEYVILEEDWVVNAPPHLSWEEAATLPCSALTAWSALMGPRPVTAADTVLTIGSGGVSIFAIQFARMLGAQVIALTSKDEKADIIQSIGANHVINYITRPEWHKEIFELTNGVGISRVVETGGTDTFEKSIQAVALGGEIALVSPSGTIVQGSDVNLSKILMPIFLNLITIRPLFVGNRLSLEAMCKAISHNNLKPIINKIFSFEEAQSAYHYLAQGEQLGKVVISGI
jgi:NADPH:quinone reductase-like Zn-dependent oxidoreductase